VAISDQESTSDNFEILVSSLLNCQKRSVIPVVRRW